MDGGLTLLKCKLHRLLHVRPQYESKEFLDDFDDALDLAVGEFGIDGQAQAFARGFFGDGEIAGFIAE